MSIYALISLGITTFLIKLNIFENNEEQKVSQVKELILVPIYEITLKYKFSEIQKYRERDKETTGSSQGQGNQTTMHAGWFPLDIIFFFLAPIINLIIYVITVIARIIWVIAVSIFWVMSIIFNIFIILFTSKLKLLVDTNFRESKFYGLPIDADALFKLKSTQVVLVASCLYLLLFLSFVVKLLLVKFGFDLATYLIWPFSGVIAYILIRTVISISEKISALLINAFYFNPL